MKFLFNASLIILVFIFVSCSKEYQDDIQPPVKTVETKILMNGDINVGDEFPMFNAPNESIPDNDIYGIQVYARSKYPSSSTYKPYAYGIFDDLSKVTISLPDNMLYKIVVSLVRQGKTVLYSLRGEYREPFASGSRYFPITNAFAETSSVVLSGLYLGRASVRDDNLLGYSVYTHPAINRYAGHIEDFAPCEGCDIEVELKTVNFGIRLSAVGLTDGYVELSVNGAPPMRINTGDQSVDMNFSLSGYGATNVWLEDNYSETIVLKAKWVRQDKSEISLGVPEGISRTVKRNFRFPVIAHVTWSQSGGSITVKEETMIDQPEIIF